MRVVDTSLSFGAKTGEMLSGFSANFSFIFRMKSFSVFFVFDVAIMLPPFELLRFTFFYGALPISLLSENMR